MPYPPGPTVRYAHGTEIRHIRNLVCRTDYDTRRVRNGVPDDVLARVDERVEIPMVGWGASLNVPVAGSLVAYWLAKLL